MQLAAAGRGTQHGSHAEHLNGMLRSMRALYYTIASLEICSDLHLPLGRVSALTATQQRLGNCWLRPCCVSPFSALDLHIFELAQPINKTGQASRLLCSRLLQTSHAFQRQESRQGTSAARLCRLTLHHTASFELAYLNRVSMRPESEDAGGLGVHSGPQ